MTQDKAEQHVIFASTILLALFAGLTLFIASIARQTPNQTRRPAARRIGRNAQLATVQTEAVLRSERACTFQTFVHRQSKNRQMLNSLRIISNGKGGMPAFKDSLSEDQIHALVTHIRTLHQKK